MSKQSRFGLFLLAALGMTNYVAAQAADLFVVHGINGTDLGADESLPVDVGIGDECTELTGVTFRTITEEPLVVDPGEYTIKIYLADGDAPCNGTLAIVKTISIQFGENSSVVAHLTEQGTPTLTKFVNDVRSTDPGEGRVSARHTAAAPPVIVEQDIFPEISNGEQRAIEVAAGTIDITIIPFNEHPIGPIPLDVQEAKNTIVYAVGSLKNGTFEPLVQVLNADQ